MSTIEITVSQGRASSSSSNNQQLRHVQCPSLELPLSTTPIAGSEFTSVEEIHANLDLLVGVHRTRSMPVISRQERAGYIAAADLDDLTSKLGSMKVKTAAELTAETMKAEVQAKYDQVLACFESKLQISEPMPQLSVLGEWDFECHWNELMRLAARFVTAAFNAFVDVEEVQLLICMKATQDHNVALGKAEAAIMCSLQCAYFFQQQVFDTGKEGYLKKLYLQSGPTYFLTMKRKALTGIQICLNMQQQMIQLTDQVPEKTEPFLEGRLQTLMYLIEGVNIEQADITAY